MEFQVSKLGLGWLWTFIYAQFLTTLSLLQWTSTTAHISDLNSSAVKLQVLIFSPVEIPIHHQFLLQISKDSLQSQATDSLWYSSGGSSIIRDECFRFLFRGLRDGLSIHIMKFSAECILIIIIDICDSFFVYFTIAATSIFNKLVFTMNIFCEPVIHFNQSNRSRYKSKCIDTL